MSDSLPAPRAPFRIPARLWLLAIVVVIGLTSCLESQRTHGDVPPQKWWQQRGPVVPHDKFPADCSLCHTSSNWAQVRADFTFDHEKETGVPLKGAHAQAECLRCHNDRGPVAGFAARGCVGCHEDIHQGKLGPQCTDCHSQDDWNPIGQVMEHNRTRFPLVGAHVAAACTECHKGADVGNFQGAQVECAGCHQADLKQATAPDHVAQGWVDRCDRCHVPTTWKGAGFTHTFFPLTAGHAALDCAACHASNIFKGTSDSCASCHLDDFSGTTNPDHSAIGFSQQCQECHSTAGWQGAVFDHSSFPLTGAHAATACAQCHVGGVYQGTPSTCVACHLADFNGTTEPDHEAVEFSQDCQQCHNTAAWQGATFDHSSFPLTGAHTAASCTQCHVGGVYKGTPSTCVACHLADFNGTTEPDHEALGFTQDCQQCHSTATWDGAVFDHSSFPLTGAHAATSCSQCHSNGVYIGTPKNCVACHLADFNRASDPDHTAAGFSQDCQQCHSTAGWDGANFDHSSFPLTGAHSGASCTQCHVNNVFQGTPNACVACHLADFNGTTEPNHQAIGYSQQCQQCHSTATWDGAVLDHSSFPLTGAHTGTSCTQCHSNGVYIGTPKNCVACHLSDFNGTNDPSHSAAGFSQDCQQCHTTATWAGANFDHSSFPLTGAHTGASCTQCHVNNVFQGTPTNCVACHLTDFNGATDPNHVAAGFPQQCQQCHNTATWSGATFDHSSFPLTGAHTAASCTACHSNGVFKGTPKNCVACHLSDFNGTTNPNHAAAGFPQTCQQCHGTYTWAGATFDHSSFPLTGAHTAASCSQCHVNGVFQGTPSACVACHLTDYNSTNNPNHATSGFPTTCQTCHDTNTWQGAVFDHSFPITSGKHKNLACIDCHVVPGNTSIFSCIDCHEHNKTDMDKEHKKKNGYVYSSPACLNCHPKGKAD